MSSIGVEGATGKLVGAVHISGDFKFIITQNHDHDGAIQIVGLFTFSHVTNRNQQWGCMCPFWQKYQMNFF